MPTVHTTGVNWESVAAIVTILSIVFGFIARMVGSMIVRAIDKFQIRVVNQLEHRLTTVETQVTDIQNNMVRRR